ATASATAIAAAGVGRTGIYRGSRVSCPLPRTTGRGRIPATARGPYLRERQQKVKSTQGFRGMSFERDVVRGRAALASARDAAEPDTVFTCPDHARPGASRYAARTCC